MHIVAQKYGVAPLIRLRHTIRSAVFDEQKGTWALSVENAATGTIELSEVDVYVPATGVLRYAHIFRNCLLPSCSHEMK